MKFKFICSFILAINLCLSGSSSDNVINLSVIQVTGDFKLTGNIEQGKVELAIQSSDADLQIDLSNQNVVAGANQTIGAQFVSQVQKIEPYIQNLPPDQLNNLASTTVIYANVVKPQSTPKDSNPVPNYLDGAVLYNGKKLGLKPDTLKDSGDEINNTVFGWLASIAQFGAGWSESQNSAVSQGLSTCKSNTICFDAKDFAAVHKILKPKLAGNYTAEQAQKALYSVVKANELLNGPDEDDLLIVFSVLNRLIALWLHHKTPEANRANFSVVNCQQDFDFLNSKQNILTLKATDYANSMNAFIQAQSAFVKCMQTEDKLSISADALPGAEVYEYLVSAIGMATVPQCVAEFNAWTAAYNNVSGSMLKLFNAIDLYPGSQDSTASVNKASNATSIATNKNYQDACGWSTPKSVIFGLDAKISPYVTNKYASNANEGVVNKVVLIDPVSKDPYLGYANASGQFNFFFDSENKPLLNSSGSPIEHFHLAPDGDIYDKCPKGQNCALVTMCPTKFTAGSGITSCKMLTECPTDDGSGNAPQCYKVLLQPGPINNSLCLVNQDIKNRIKLSMGLCYGEISSKDFSQLSTAQASADKAAASVKRESQKQAFSFAYGMVVMPATFALVTKGSEWVGASLSKAWTTREVAIKAKYGEDMTKARYAELSEEGILDQYNNLRKFDPKLSYDDLKNGARIMDRYDLPVSQTRELLNLDPAKRANVLKNLSKGEKFGKALVEANLETSSSSATGQDLKKLINKSTTSVSAGDTITPEMAQGWERDATVKIGDANFNFVQKIIQDGKTFYEFNDPDGAEKFGSFDEDGKFKLDDKLPDLEVHID